jgi:hypothetical protein
MTHSEIELGNFYLLENTLGWEDKTSGNYKSCVLLGHSPDDLGTEKPTKRGKNHKVIDWLQHI